MAERHIDGRLALELDAEISERLFCRRVRRVGRWKQWAPDTQRWVTLPNYSSSLDDAHLVRDEMERRGLCEEFMAELQSEIIACGGPSIASCMCLECKWALLDVSATQIVRAALAVLANRISRSGSQEG